VKNQIQRGIIVGAKGAVVGAIGLMARNELQQLWGIPVHLIINVIVDG
jgi:GTPase Era involved in 16S rRNA processing